MSEKIDTGLHYPLTLSRLPQSWTACYVGTVCAEVQSGFACGKHNDSDIGVAHLRPMNVNRRGNLEFEETKFVAADHDSRRLNEGDVLFNNTNSPDLIGKTAFVTSRGAGLAFSNHMTRLRFRPEIVPKFAAYQLHFLWMTRYFLHRCVKHVNQASISAGELSKTIPFISPPTKEQFRIVAKIEELFSELDKGIENLRTAQAQLKVYRQSLLKSAFEGKLTAQWRADNPDKFEPAETLFARIQKERAACYQKNLAGWEKAGRKGAKPKVPKIPAALTSEELSEFTELPDGWFAARLGWMTCSVEYGSSAKSEESGDCPVLRMGNIQNGKFDWGDLVFTSNIDEINRYLLHEGDVLFNRTNSPELVGKTAIFKSNKKAVFAGYLIRINNIKSIVLSDYLNYYLCSDIAKNHGNKVKTDGVNQSNINGQKLMNYPFPFCTLNEQMAIASLLEARTSEIDQLQQILATSLQQAEALRQSILKKAFSGQLVPQDAKDEPASELLERIKTEQLTAPKPKKVRK